PTRATRPAPDRRWRPGSRPCWPSGPVTSTPPGPPEVGRLAVVGGHTVLDVALPAALADAHRERAVPVPGGPVHLVDAGPVVFLQRHRQADYVLAPHLDHHAHVAALAAV